MLLGPMSRSWCSRQSLVIAGPGAGDIKRLAPSPAPYRLLEAGLSAGAKFSLASCGEPGKELRGCVQVPVLGWSLSLQLHRETCVLLRCPECSTLPSGFAPIAQGEVERKSQLGMLQEKDLAVLSEWVRGNHVCSLTLVHFPPCGE